MYICVCKNCIRTPRILHMYTHTQLFQITVRTMDLETRNFKCRNKIEKELCLDTTYFAHMYTYIYIYVLLDIDLYIYIYIYLYLYIHIYVYIYMCVCKNCTRTPRILHIYTHMKLFRITVHTVDSGKCGILIVEIKLKKNCTRTPHILHTCEYIYIYIRGV